MKWVQFEHNGQRSFGQLDGDMVSSTDLSWPDVLAAKSATTNTVYPLSQVKLLAPLVRPGKIVAIGLNYLDHCRETNTPPPEKPLVFTKFTTSMTDPNTPIRWSGALTQQVDFEAELAVIISKTARYVEESEALNYVFGYTAANDVSARDLQFGDGQWIRGKSLDTFCPIGPVLVTADEIPDPQTLAIKCELNGHLVQDSSTSEMIFNVAQLISFCSNAFTLEAGDVILTGTPHGTGAFRDPKLFMQNNDKVTIEIEGIGRLENHCEVTA